MSIENAFRNRAVLLENLGKSVMNLKYPKEFELYVIALELVDGAGRVLKYFIFPVNPSSLDETNQSITNVKKTLTGVVSLRNPTFVPMDINLSGTFGRRLRVLLGSDYVDFVTSFTVDNQNITADSIKKGVQELFDERVKTGYGCLNILKDILTDSAISDSNGPRTLILHNLAFGSSYVVEPVSIKTSMTQETNMMHSYAIALKAVAPLDALKGTNLKDEREQLVATGYLQDQTNRLLQGLTKIIS